VFISYQFFSGGIYMYVSLTVVHLGGIYTCATFSGRFIIDDDNNYQIICSVDVKFKQKNRRDGVVFPVILRNAVRVRRDRNPFVTMFAVIVGSSGHDEFRLRPIAWTVLVNECIFIFKCKG
jgi:hypothetical protein